MLNMTSQDAIHSFFVPAFRLKQDVLPGRYTSLWFTPTQLGEFHLFCAEYCGSEHSQMIGRVVVMRPDDFSRWLGVRAGRARASRSTASRCFGSSAAAAATTRDRPCMRRCCSGCRAGRCICRTAARVVADDNYLRDSILQPRKDVVAGFEPRDAVVRGPGQRGRPPGADRVSAFHRGGAAAVPENDHELSRPTASRCARGSRRIDHKRIAILYAVAITGFFFIGGAAATIMRLELATPAGDLVAARHLQQAVHRARRDHGLAVPDPVDPVGDRQLPGAADDRRARPGVSAAEPAELVSVRAGGADHPGRAVPRAASTPAGRSTRRTRRCSRTPTSRWRSSACS